jgi:hypothetical protein
MLLQSNAQRYHAVNGVPQELLVGQIADNNPIWFERLLLIRCMYDPTFWQGYGTALANIEILPGVFESIRRFDSPLAQGLFTAWGQALTLVAGAFTSMTHVANTVSAVLQAESQQGRLIAASELQPCMELLSSILNAYGELDNAKLVTQEHLVEWVLRSSATYLQSMAGAGKITAVQAQKQLAAELNKLSRLREKAERNFMFGSGFDNPLPQLPRVSTGLAALDEALGGGAARGEASLGIATTGGGKTVLAAQISAVMATQSRSPLNQAWQPGQARTLCKVCYITTEPSQKHHKLETRIASNMGNIPYKLIKDGFDRERLTEPQIRQFQQVRELLGEGNLMFHEWDKERGFSDPLGYMRSIVDEAEQLMQGLDVLILDWVGGALPESSADHKRHAFQTTGDGFCDIVGDRNLIGHAFAQAHVSYINKLHLDGRAISECKSLSQNFTSQYGLTTLTKPEGDVTGAGGKSPYAETQYIYLGKSRAGEGGCITVRRNFDFQRFEAERMVAIARQARAGAQGAAMGDTLLRGPQS